MPWFFFRRKNKRSYLGSSSFAVAAVFAFLLSSAVVLLGVYLYWTSRNYFIDTTVNNINALIAGITVIEETLPELSREHVIMRLVQLDPTVYYQLYDHSYEVFFSNVTLPPPESVLVEGTLLFDLPTGNENGEVQKIAARIHTFDDGMYLLMGMDISTSLGRQKTIELLIWCSIVSMLLLVFLSFFVGNFVVRRINLIAQTADKIISTGDLSQRIKLKTRWDDLSILADLLNQLLQRIEELVRGVRQVSNSIAHDLRTPLTHLRHRIEEIILNNDRLTEDERRESIEELASTTDTILSTFSALLRISSIENAKQQEQFADFSLQKVVEDVAELYAPIIEDNGQKLSTSFKSMFMFGDQHLIFQMLSNLLDNAKKYSPQESVITFQLSKHRDVAHIVLRDMGPGIPAELRDKVFERFFRVDKSRSTSGNGLGLTLVDAVIQLHNGCIRLSNVNPGLRIDILLPISQSKLALKEVAAFAETLTKSLANLR